MSLLGNIVTDTPPGVAGSLPFLGAENGLVVDADGKVRLGTNPLLLNTTIPLAGFRLILQANGGVNNNITFFPDGDIVFDNGGATPVGLGLGGVRTANNLRFGFSALQNVAVGSDHNIGIGDTALGNLTTGINNIAMGWNTMLNCTDATFCTAIGVFALQNMTHGVNHCAFGNSAMQKIADGMHGNSAFGGGAGLAGANVLNGSENTFIGYLSTWSNNNISNSTAVGANVVLAQSNTVVLGTATEKVGVAGINTPSAKLHLPAGAAAAGLAPFKFTSGTNQTVAEAGAMEYNGTNLFFSRVAATRETVFTGVSGAAAPATTVGVGIVSFYGASAVSFLGTPNSWASVVINGTTFKVPLYT